ncbi:MAG: efflux RND transporter permease subunit [Bdellovibrionales bacterium]|nr:efflux RND transporter permease subunit [Bdellovibrionales bacterium]
MNLIDLSIRRTVFAWVLMFSLILFGAISMNRMGVSQMPDVNFPILDISVSYPGAAPEVVEADLLDPMESSLLSIEGIQEMKSTASQGSGKITLEFAIDRNVDVALQEVQTALSQQRLPQGVDPPVIKKQNPEEDPIMIVSIFADTEVKEILDWIDAVLLDSLRFLPGVGEVDIAGFSQRNLRIWLEPEKLRRLELTVQDVVDTLRTQHIESAAGQFTEGERELRVRWLGEASSPDEVGDILILRRGGQLIHDSRIRVKDVARVEDGLSDIRRLARYDGKTTVALRIKKQRGTNEVEVAAGVRAKMEAMAANLPKGYAHRINVDFTRSTRSTVELTIEKLVMAGVITILVCFLFLGSLQAAVNILFSIPTSIIGTFIILKFSGFTLNLFTLLALTLAISIVVDDAIMLLENIVRHYRMGKGSKKAASDGAKEVLPAAIAATLAVVAIFLPVVFMDGVIGKFFFQFGVTISAAVLISLLEAATITPMRAAAFLSTEPKVGRFEQYLEDKFEHFGNRYRNALALALKWKGAVVGASLVVFAVSLVVLTRLRQEFVPPQDQDILIIMAQTPPGSSLEATNRVSAEIEKAIKKVPEVVGFVVSVQPNHIFIPAALSPKGERELTHVDVMAKLREAFKEVKGARISMRDNSVRNLTSGPQNPLSIGLRGGDLNVLNDKAQELMRRLESEGLGVDMDTSYRVGIPELVISPDRGAMARRAISIETVGQTLSAAVGGLREGRYTADGRRYDIRFKFPESKIRSAEDIKAIDVRNSAGNLVPLRDVVRVKEQNSSLSITRVNRQRAISVYGNIAPGKSQAKVLDRAQEIARAILPVGYTFELEGASAGFSAAFGSLFDALIIGVLVAYLILAVQFNSFVHPISVLMALPFSATGALLALWAFGVSLNLFSFIGLIVLMGIAKKNSILLVEFTNQKRRPTSKDGSLAMSRDSAKVRAALLEACPVRLRPILMTSVATVAAALPLVIGSGMGAEARLPMGLAIIGGTIVSTALTLFVVPAIYLMLSRLERGEAARKND